MRGISTILLDGKALAELISKETAKRVADIKAKRAKAPGLAVILVGEDPASQIYVNNKQKACNKLGINSFIQKLPDTISQERIIDHIKELNNDENVDGILVQLPLPKGIDTNKVINSISPEKDVDGFHPINAGKLLRGENCLEPCTPKGIIRLVEHTGVAITGKKVCVIGRSNIVGKPISLMFLKRDATVTMCHTKTIELDKIAAEADILIVAAGRPKVIDEKYIKEGAIVIDVGINRTANGLCGDVDFEKVYGKAGWLTPVPGGVGPMTIAMLLENTIIAAEGRG